MELFFPRAFDELIGAYWYVDATLRPPIAGWRYEGPGPVRDGWLLWRCHDKGWSIHCLLHWAGEGPLADIQATIGQYPTLHELLVDATYDGYQEVRPLVVALMNSGHVSAAEFAAAENLQKQKS